MALRVAVLGAGHGQAWLDAFSKIEGCSLEALAALPDDDRRQDAQQKFGIPPHRLFASGSDLLGVLDGKLDLVVVATPPATHRTLCCAALEQGCAVLCEKPPATNFRDAQAMYFRSLFCGPLLAWAWCFRSAQNLPPSRPATRTAHIAWQRSTASGAQWALDHEVSGGGALLDFGIHGLDTTLYLMGYPDVIAVHAEAYDAAGQRTGGRGHGRIEHRVTGTLHTATGADISLDVNWGAKEEKQEIAFNGPFGQDKVSVVADNLLYWRCANSFLKLLFESNRARQLEHTSGGVALMKIIDALYQSCTTNRTVTL